MRQRQEQGPQRVRERARAAVSSRLRRRTSWGLGEGVILIHNNLDILFRIYLEIDNASIFWLFYSKPHRFCTFMLMDADASEADTNPLDSTPCDNCRTNYYFDGRII